jgi:hypothetical protein
MKKTYFDLLEYITAKEPQERQIYWSEDLGYMMCQSGAICEYTKEYIGDYGYYMAWFENNKWHDIFIDATAMIQFGEEYPFIRKELTMPQHKFVVQMVDDISQFGRLKLFIPRQQETRLGSADEAKKIISNPGKIIDRTKHAKNPYQSIQSDKRETIAYDEKKLLNYTPEEQDAIAESLIKFHMEAEPVEMPEGQKATYQGYTLPGRALPKADSPLLLGPGDEE